MSSDLKEVLWSQFGAAIDMLENAMAACTDELWRSRNGKHEFWYLAYHALFWLDVYSSESAENYTPPSPFTLSEFDEDGILPDRVYEKAELHRYLEYGREKSKTRIETLTDKKAAARFIFGTLNLSSLEMIIYNMRHLQHHTAQLNMLLRQNLDSAPKWVRQGKQKIGRLQD